MGNPRLRDPIGSLLGVFGFVALAVLLRRASESATVRFMPIVAAKKPARKAATPGAAAARRRRAEDKADYALAAKRVAKIEKTGGKFYTGAEVLREMGLQD